MTIEFRYREEESEITGKILRPVAALQFKSRSGEWVESFTKETFIMKKKLVSIILVAMLVSAGLSIFVGNAVAEIGTHAKAVPCVEANIQSMSNTPIISLSSNPMTFYSKVMKLEEVKRKLIDAKNKGIIGSERHFFDRRALERSIAPRDVGEVVDSCEIVTIQAYCMLP